MRIAGIRQVDAGIGRSAIGLSGIVRSGILCCGIVRSGMPRDCGWIIGAEGAERALGALGTDGALGALGADRAEGAFGALGADCAEGALGALGAEGAEGALGADWFGYAVFFAACARGPRGPPLWPSCGICTGLKGEVTALGGAGGAASAARQQPKRHAMIWAFIRVIPWLLILDEDEMTAGIAPDPQQDVVVFAGLGQLRRLRSAADFLLIDSLNNVPGAETCLRCH